MSRSKRRKNSIAPWADTQVVGFRLPRELAREVKTEASRSGVKLNRVFVKILEQYKDGKPKGD